MSQKTEISADAVRKLREETGIGVMACKKALAESKGNPKGALEFLRAHGVTLAAKKADRKTSEGIIFAYIHFGGKIGVLLELNCETDFVAKTDEFKQLAKDISMHIAWSNPRFLREEEVPSEALKHVKNKEKFLAQNCLLRQHFLKDNEVTVKDYLTSLIAKIGENIKIARFVRYQVGSN